MLREITPEKRAEFENAVKRAPLIVTEQEKKDKEWKEALKKAALKYSNSSQKKDNIHNYLSRRKRYSRTIFPTARKQEIPQPQLVENAPEQKPLEFFIEDTKPAIAIFYQPTLSELGRFYEQELDVVGEKKTIFRMTLDAIINKSFILIGPSGGGKSFLLDNFLTTIPEELIYRLNDTKRGALFKHADKFKDKILAVAEIQTFLRDTGNEKDAFRAIANGERYTYLDNAEEITLEARFIAATCAEENQYWQRHLDNNPEFKRRFDVIYIDKSPEKVERIRHFKNQKRMNGIFTPEYRQDIDRSVITNYIKRCMSTSLDERLITDPYSSFIDQYIPKTFRSLAYIDKYHDSETALLKWHLGENTYHYNGQEFYIIGLKLKYINERIFREDICRTLLELDNLNESNEYTEKAKQEVDWQACFESGLESLRQANFPEPVISEYINRHVINGRIIVNDPLTEQDVFLAEYPKQKDRECIIITPLERFEDSYKPELPGVIDAEAEMIEEIPALTYDPK